MSSKGNSNQLLTPANTAALLTLTFCLMYCCTGTAALDQPGPYMPFMLRTGGLQQGGQRMTRNNKQPGCDGNVLVHSQSMGIIKYPQQQYGSSSSQPVNCAWLIRAPDTKVVGLIVKELSLPESPDCADGALTVYAGRTEQSPVVARLCGTVSHQRLLADSSDVLVTYESRVGGGANDGLLSATWFFRSA